MGKLGISGRTVDNPSQFLSLFHFLAGLMSNHLSIHFQYKDRVFSITMKTSVQDMTLSLIEERMYKKLGLNERKEKLKMSYMSMVVRCERPLNIVDDEDFFVYLTLIDKEN